MKIALVGRRSGSHGEALAKLARGLRAASFEVELFSCDDSAESQALALSELFARAAQFDLIHSFLGPGILAAANLVHAPILTTLERAPGAELALLCARLHGRAWFAASSETAGAPNVALSAVIPPGDEHTMAHAYAELYARVLDQDRARRMDLSHDRRPWGEYWVLLDDPHFKVKRLDVLPGKRLSYQRHARRSEHWTVVAGRARVTLDDAVVELEEGGTIEIPIGAAHRVENPGSATLTLIEVQRGSYFGEDDIQRLSDDFGRS